MQPLNFVRKKFVSRIYPRAVPDSRVNSRPKARSSRRISLGSALFYIAAPFVVGLIAGLLGEFTPTTPTVRLGLWAFAVAMVVSGVLISPRVLDNLVTRIAPLLLVPHRIESTAQAKRFLQEYLDKDVLADRIVTQGKLMPGPEFANENSWERLTRYKPGVLDIDASSAVMLWQPGGYALLLNGRYQYDVNQQIIATIDLIPQMVSVDDWFWTADGMRVQIKGILSYELIQDNEYFKVFQSRSTNLETVQRALASVPEWRERAGKTITTKLREIIKQIALSDFFVTTNHLYQLDAYQTYRRVYSYQPSKLMLDEIEKRVIDETMPILDTFGVKMRFLRIDSLAPPQDVTDAAKRIYDRWLDLLSQEVATVHNSRLEIEQAQHKYQLADIEQRTKMKQAETEKGVKDLIAQAEANEYAQRMKARADGAVEFAHSIETMRGVMGNMLNEKTAHEFFRALNLLRQDPFEEQEILGMVRSLLQERERKIND